MDMYHGSCLCNQITFSVTGFSPKVANCHCRMCRKFHGSAFSTLTQVQGMVWLSGVDLLQDYTANNGTIRTFCSQCGSSLGFRVKDTPFSEMEIAIACFDEDIPVHIDAQIYTAYKANWCALNTNIAIFEEGRAT